MEIVHKKVSDLKKYSRNSKKHPPEQIKQLAASIKEFGFKNPILLDINDEIIAGHGRFEAAKTLKLKTVPCIIVSDLTPAQVKAYRIADNKLAESEWDMEFLNEELAWLKDLDFDLKITGWFDTVEPETDSEPEPDSEPKEKQYILTVKCNNDAELEELFQELNSRGFKVKA